MKTPTLGKKIVAFIIDLMVINLFIIPSFSGVLSSMVPKHGFSESMQYYRIMMSDPNTVTILTLVSVIISLYILLYFTLSEYIAGTTIGMALMGMEVIDSKKKKPGLFVSMVRNLYCIPFFPFILLWIAEPVFLFMKGMRLSEYLTNTKTIFG